MFRRKNVWYFLWIFPVVVIVCLDQQLPPHTVNVALNKPATQKGDLNDKIWCPKPPGAVCGVKKANLSVDGNTDTQYWNGSCSHADIQNKPWWQVDLGQVYNISWIKIYNRVGKCQSNRFGLNCMNQCHCMNNTTCDKTTGYCQNGCAAGWIGTGCQTACQNNTFGLNCMNQCHCMNNTTCDKTTGYCQNGCAAGWIGTGCQTGPGTAKDDVSSIITPIMVSCVVIVVVLCVTVVIVCYIRRKQGPNHQEENKNQSERHYAGLESGRDDGDYSSLNCAYEEFPNTLPGPAPSNTTDSTGHSLYANEGIESQMRDLNPDCVVYANGAVQMD